MFYVTANSRGKSEIAQITLLSVKCNRLLRTIFFLVDSGRTVEKSRLAYCISPAQSPRTKKCDKRYGTFDNR